MLQSLGSEPHNPGMKKSEPPALKQSSSLALLTRQESKRLAELEQVIKEDQQVNRRRFRLALIADTSGEFSDFSPYVASINNAGLVAFQATLKRGGAGLFTGDGGLIATVDDTTHGRFINFSSHPDINGHGASCFYAELKLGGQEVMRISNGQKVTIADTNGPFESIGPLGPTLDEGGTVAFRAGLRLGGSGIYSGNAKGSIVTIADTLGTFSAFHGLPVVNRHGAVVFRADQKDGRQGIYSGSGGSLATIAETGSFFSGLGLFPTMNDQGAVAFAGMLPTGGAGVFTAADGRITAVVDAHGGFESFRGAFINNEGDIVYCATPTGGKLGIYSGPDPIGDRIISLGDPLFGSAVAEFALNPVSLNDLCQISIRVRLADGRQVIIRVNSRVASERWT